MVKGGFRTVDIRIFRLAAPLVSFRIDEAHKACPYLCSRISANVMAVYFVITLLTGLESIFSCCWVENNR